MSKIDLIIDALSISQNSVWSKLNEQALAAARELQALAQPEQEPVAYKYTDKTNPLVFYFTERKGKDVTQNPDVIETALYTAPPKREWVGLTDEEIEVIAKRLMDDAAYCSLHFAVAIGAKLKEKNGG